MTIEEQEYKGHKVLVFKDSWPGAKPDAKPRILFCAGIKKVNLILENIESLKDFSLRQSVTINV